MTIDINELRRLAQAALIGPDGFSMRWLKLLKDFQEEANPSVICELIDRLELAESRQATYKKAFEISENTFRDLTEKVIPNIRKKLEVAEKDITLKERIIDSLGSTLNAVSNERDVLRDRLALESQENGALRDSVDRACEERDELRTELKEVRHGVAVAHDTIKALRARIEAAEKEVAHIKEVEFPRKARAVVVGWETKCARLEQDRDELRARVEAMERQEPVAWRRRSDCGWSYKAKPVNGLVLEPLYLAPGAQPAPFIPEGWKLVPIEPTPEMKTAGIGVEVYQASPPSTDSLTWEEAAAIYAAMLAAAPKPEGE